MARGNGEGDADRVLCETSNKRDHDKQFLLQWRRGANTPYFQDNLCRGGGSQREAWCLFRIFTRHRRFLCFNANAISEFSRFQLAGTD